MLRKVFLVLTILGVLLGSFLFIGGQDRLLNFIFKDKQEQPLAEFPQNGQTFYQMKFKVDTRQNILYGSGIIATINTTGQPLQSLHLLLYPQIMAEPDSSPAPFDAYYAGFTPSGMKLSNLQVNSVPCEAEIDGINATLQMATPIEPGANINIQADWEIPMPLVNYRLGRYYSLWFFSECYPILIDREFVQPSFARKLYGQPFSPNAADYEVSVIYPDTLNLVTNAVWAGRQAAQDGHEVVVVEALSIRDFCFFLLYDYNQEEAVQNDHRLASYFPASKSANSPLFLSAACDIINFYEGLFGAYPYTELTLIAVPFKGLHGMEYSGLSLLQASFTESGYEMERQTFLLAQHLAHQWWGGLVGNDQLEEPWLDEGLACWCAYQYMENRLGVDTSYRTPLPRVQDFGAHWQEQCAGQEYHLTGYSGPEEFWFGLEKQIGQKMMYRVLAKYARAYSFKHAGTRDLLAIVNQETGSDYTDFFAGWFPSEFANTEAP